MNAGVLSKVAAQVSIYFEKAFEANQVNPNLRNFDNKKIANVLGYHSKYFKAMAYWNLGQFQYKEASDKGKGMNLAVAYLTISVETFQNAQNFAVACGGAYQSNFNAKFADAQALLAKATDENKKIYYE